MAIYRIAGSATNKAHCCASLHGLLRALFSGQPSQQAALQSSSWDRPAQPLKYFLPRTALAKELPLYTDFKNGRSRVLTIIKHIEGDFEVLYSELVEILPPATKITVRADISQIKIQGRFVTLLKNYFTQKGL